MTFQPHSIQECYALLCFVYANQAHKLQHGWVHLQHFVQHCQPCNNSYAAARSRRQLQAVSKATHLVSPAPGATH